MANISISQMNTRAEANLSDLHEVAYADGNSQTGYASGKMTMEVMANAIVNDFAYQSLGNKTVKGAIEDAEVTVDTALDDTSLNPIANKPVAEAIADIVGDISDIDTNIEGSKQLTTTGNVITVSDSAATYLEELEVEVEPIQDLHGYEYPWVGGAGKNLLPYDISWIKSNNTTGTWSGNIYALNGLTFNFNNDGTFVVNGTCNSATTIYLYDATFLADSPSGTYTLNGCYSGGGNATYNMDVQGATGSDYGNGVNLIYDNTLSNTMVRLRIYINAPTFTNALFQPMIRLATVTDSTFAPYSNICPISGYDDVSVETTDEEETTTNTITATFDNTVYSGHVDFTSGILTVDKAMVDLGSLSWTYDSTYGTLTNRWYTTISNAKLPLDNATVANIISEKYQARSIADMHNNGGNGIGIAKSNGYTYCYNQSSTTEPSGQLVYELATPQTYNLTPQQLQMLKGYNTVTTDANGGMTIKYQPDNVVGEIKAYASRLYDDILDRLEALSE